MLKLAYFALEMGEENSYSPAAPQGENGKDH
jgi:hypothetical protein